MISTLTASSEPHPARGTSPLRVGFVMHIMQVAGAEVLVAEIIRRLGERIQPTIFCLDGIGTLGEQLQQQGIDVVCLNRHPGFDRSLAFRFAREIRQRKIDVLHAHQYTPFFYSALTRLLGARRTRIILTEHGRHFPDVVSPKRRIVNRLLLSRLADRINACSQFSGSALSQLDGFPADRVEVIYNGVDTEQFLAPPDTSTARTQLGLDPQRLYVAMIARFHPIKDHESVLRAFQVVCQQRDDADLLLVGDGELRADMEQLACDLDIRKRVHFWGVRDDVATILQAIDVFTLSSISEAASLTLLEAMACGRPVSVTHVGGNPEIVTDGVTGRLTPRQDPQALGQALLDLLNDAALRERLGSAARQTVLKNFQLDQAIHRYEQLYAELTPAK